MYQNSAVQTTLIALPTGCSMGPPTSSSSNDNHYTTFMNKSSTPAYLPSNQYSLCQSQVTTHGMRNLAFPPDPLSLTNTSAGLAMCQIDNSGMYNLCQDSHRYSVSPVESRQLKTVFNFPAACDTHIHQQIRANSHQQIHANNHQLTPTNNKQALTNNHQQTLTWNVNINAWNKFNNVDLAGSRQTVGQGEYFQNFFPCPKQRIIITCILA